jgi:lysophospholipase L1-like esterase
MRVDQWRRRAILLVALIAILLLAGADGVPPLPTPAPAPPKAVPAAIVSMGDSTISGEGAGDYEAGTDGQNGDWCHRSTDAEINKVSLPGVVKPLNLACSGADSSDVGLGKAVHYTEPAQATRLALIARQYRIQAIVVATGANDDPQFANTLTSCVQAWFSSGNPGCSANFDHIWQRRVNLMVPKVVNTLRDIRRAMTGAGYAPDSYQLVLQSYAAPLGPDVAAGYQNLNGCPLRSSDLDWIRDTGVVMLDDGLHRAATQAGVRYLDLDKAGLGHEACSGGANPSNEWFTRLTVAWQDLQTDNRASHALQQSFHPNARGQAAFGECLAAFLGTDDEAASCLSGADGALRPAAIIPSG